MNWDILLKRLEIMTRAVGLAVYSHAKGRHALGRLFWLVAWTAAFGQRKHKASIPHPPALHW